MTILDIDSVLRFIAVSVTFLIFSILTIGFIAFEIFAIFHSAEHAYIIVIYSLPLGAIGALMYGIVPVTGLWLGRFARQHDRHLLAVAASGAVLVWEFSMVLGLWGPETVLSWTIGAPTAL